MLSSALDNTYQSSSCTYMLSACWSLRVGVVIHQRGTQWKSFRLQITNLNKKMLILIALIIAPLQAHTCPSEECNEYAFSAGVIEVCVCVCVCVRACACVCV